MDEHQHMFEARYKMVDGEMVIENPCKCTGCDRLAFIEYENYKVIITLAHTGDVTYTVTVSERDKQP
jgi:hypothetical protein